jgi:O-antigen ligase
MASSLSVRAGHDWAVTHPAAETRTFRWIVPIVLVGVLFQLATSDGGRHVPSLVFAQSAVFAMLAVVVWAGARSIPLLPPLAAMVGITAFGALVSVRPEASIGQLLLWLMYLGLAALVGSTITGAGSARRFLDGIAVIAGWVCLIALFNFWGAGDPQMRWYSTFYWPNPFAAFLLLVLPLQVVRMLRAQTGRETLAHGALAALFTVSFVLTYSRGAWLSLAAVAPVAAIILRPRSWGTALWRGAIFAVLVAIAVIILTSSAPRGASSMNVAGRAASIGNAGDSSIQGRVHFWRAALRIFRDHPWLGTGPGTFSAVHPQYQDDPRFYARDAHNLYVQTLAETGLTGAVVLLWFLGALLALWLRTLARAQATEEYPLVAGVGLGLAAFWLHSGLDMDWAFPAVPATAFALIGVLVWYDRRDALPSRRPGAVRAWWRPLTIAFLMVIAAGMAQAGGIAHRAFVDAQRHARAHDPAAAMVDFTRAAGWNPLSGRYHAAVAAAALALPRPDMDRAGAALRRAMAVDPANASHHVQLGKGLMDHRPADPTARREAEAELRAALRLDPMNRPEAYRYLARLYQWESRDTEAARVYGDAVARYIGRELGRPSMVYALLWPQVVMLSLDAGEFAERRGQVQDAERIYRILLDEDPRAVPAALRLSALLVRQERIAEAREVLARTAARVPQSPALAAAMENLR